MPIKLSTEKNYLGLRVKKDDVIEMVTKYRTNHKEDKSKINFIHFNLSEILKLFIDNGKINKLKPIADQLNESEKFGVKIYLGNHTKEENCPRKPGSTNPDIRYKGKDNAIICTTTKVTITIEHKNKDIWKDDLEDDKSSICFTGAGEGLDRGTVCEPDCADSREPGPDNYYQTDIYHP